MASEVLNLAAQIVISHAATTELTPKQLVKEIISCLPCLMVSIMIA